MVEMAILSGLADYRNIRLARISSPLASNRACLVSLTALLSSVLLSSKDVGKEGQFQRSRRACISAPKTSAMGGRGCFDSCEKFKRRSLALQRDRIYKENKRWKRDKKRSPCCWALLCFHLCR